MEVITKFNVGDKVLIKKPHVGAYLPCKPTEFTVGGFVIHSNGKGYKVFYTMKEDINKPKKRYLEREIKGIDRRIQTKDIQNIISMLLKDDYIDNVVPISEEQANKILTILTEKTGKHYDLTQHRNVESDDIFYDLSISEKEEGDNEFREEEWLCYTR